MIRVYPLTITTATVAGTAFAAYCAGMMLGESNEVSTTCGLVAGAAIAAFGCTERYRVHVRNGLTALGMYAAAMTLPFAAGYIAKHEFSTSALFASDAPLFK